MAIYSEFSHQKWWFSIVMLVYQRVVGDLVLDIYWWFSLPEGRYTAWPAFPEIARGPLFLLAHVTHRDDLSLKVNRKAPPPERRRVRRLSWPRATPLGGSWSSPQLSTIESIIIYIYYRYIIYIDIWYMIYIYMIYIYIWFQIPSGLA